MMDTEKPKTKKAFWPKEKGKKHYLFGLNQKEPKEQKDFWPSLLTRPSPRSENSNLVCFDNFHRQSSQREYEISYYYTLGLLLDFPPN
jgi:hypothetical protein